jgi:hypothetical protein
LNQGLHIEELVINYLCYAVASYPNSFTFTCILMSKVLPLGGAGEEEEIADVNKSVVKPYGLHSTVMLIVSWCILMKVFEKSGMDICCVAVTNCLENYLSY